MAYVENSMKIHDIKIRPREVTYCERKNGREKGSLIVSREFTQNRLQDGQKLKQTIALCIYYITQSHKWLLLNTFNVLNANALLF